MVNINCSSNCIYQMDGKCTLSKVSTLNNIYNPAYTSDCIYYTSINSSKNVDIN